MSNEPKFIDGLIVKAPHDNAPDYVKAKLSFKREELIGWLQQQDGEWINADIKVSQNGKWYAAVDDWKPSGNGTPRSSGPATTQRAPRATDEPRGEFVEDDIPFISGRDKF